MCMNEWLRTQLEKYGVEQNKICEARLDVEVNVQKSESPILPRPPLRRRACFLLGWHRSIRSDKKPY